ncbi:MAG TPA: multiheme c-type cytochrome [Candidatus Binatia bacterium]|nr:multiheme c-type cytochrome [Candidatus Binatia bacterium]
MRRIISTVALVHCLAAGAAEPLPWDAPHKHLGAATCAGSTCHGANRPAAKGNVLGNEFPTWETKDAHSNAYKLLLTPAGARIAKNLGLKSAGSAPECLTCHTDFVPEARRALRYQVSDGVGCEGCHGGAQDWNRSHAASDATHAANVAAGMYPLARPEARARLCLNCHLGSAAKPIDHRIMGAGHPPLSFELDTFTAIQPAHFKVDADYEKRKGYAGNLRTWAVGQVVAAEFWLDGVASERFRQNGLVPELVFFDCAACHHATRPVRWNAQVTRALGPGEPRLADAALVMTGHIAAALVPAVGAEWDKGLEALHAATHGGVAPMKEAAAKLRALLPQVLAAANGHAMGKAEAFALLDRALVAGEQKAEGDCSAAEQTTYVVGVVNEFLKTQGAATKPLEGAYNESVDAVNCRRGDFDVPKFKAAVGKIRERAAKLR